MIQRLCMHYTDAQESIARERATDCYQPSITSIPHSLICSTEYHRTTKTNFNRTLTNTKIHLDLESQNRYYHQISKRIRTRTHDARSSFLFHYMMTQYDVIESKTKTTPSYAHSTWLVTISRSAQYQNDAASIASISSLTRSTVASELQHSM